MRRVTVSLEDEIYDYLELRSALETRTVPNLLAHLAATAYRESPIVVTPKTGPVQVLLQQTLAEEGHEWSTAQSTRERVEAFAEFCGLSPLDVFGILSGDRPDHEQIICLAMAIKRDGKSIDSTELAALVYQQYGRKQGNGQQSEQTNGV